MMTAITPILLNMHLVGIEAVQRHARGVVLLHQPLEERPRLGTEVVQLRRRVGDHHQHAIQRPDLRLALAPDRQPAGVGAALGRFIHVHLRLLLQLHDARRVHPVEAGPAHPILAKGEYPHPRPVQLDRPLVVRPGLLLPHRNGEAPRRRVPVTLAILHPLARLPRLLLVAAANLQRTQQAQLQPEPILFERLADLRQALDVGFRIRQQLPRLPALALSGTATRTRQTRE